MRKLVTIAILATALSTPAPAQLYSRGAETAPTPFSNVSFDSCALIFSHQNYTAETAWIGGYLSAASIAAPDSFKTEGGMRGIFQSVERECTRLPPDTPLINVLQRLVPIQSVE